MSKPAAKRASRVATPYMGYAAVEQYLRFPCALVMWYVFLCGVRAPFQRSAAEQEEAARRFVLWRLLAWVPPYLSSIGLFLVTMFIYENARCLVAPGPLRLSLSDDYVNGEPEKVEKMVAFEYDTPPTTYERAKMMFFKVTGVAYVRAAGAVLAIFLGMFAASTTGMLDRYAHPWWFAVWSRVTAFVSVVAFTMLGVYSIPQYGRFAARSECKIIIANHSCVWEVIWLYVMAGFPSFVSRKENLSFAFFGNIVRASSSILVDRDAATSRVQTLDAILKRAGDPAAPQLMIFPEGTTANQQTLFLFKKGVFEAAVPVQMVCIAFPYKHFNPAWTGREVGGNSMAEVLVRMCCQFVNHAEVRLLPVYHPTEEERKDPKLYAAHCQKMMATVLREKISDASYSDYKTAIPYFAERKKNQ